MSNIRTWWEQTYIGDRFALILSAISIVVIIWNICRINKYIKIYQRIEKELKEKGD